MLLGIAIARAPRAAAVAGPLLFNSAPTGARSRPAQHDPRQAERALDRRGTRAGRCRPAAPPRRAAGAGRSPRTPRPASLLTEGARSTCHLRPGTPEWSCPTSSAGHAAPRATRAGGLGLRRTSWSATRTRGGHRDRHRPTPATRSRSGRQVTIVLSDGPRRCPTWWAGRRGRARTSSSAPASRGDGLRRRRPPPSAAPCSRRTRSGQHPVAGHDRDDHGVALRGRPPPTPTPTPSRHRADTPSPRVPDAPARRRARAGHPPAARDTAQTGGGRAAGPGAAPVPSSRPATTRRRGAGSARNAGPGRRSAQVSGAVRPSSAPGVAFRRPVRTPGRRTLVRGQLDPPCGMTSQPSP